MKQPVMTDPPRRRIAHVSILGTTQMHLRNPIVIGLWSAIFPGLGHLLLSLYIRGIILFMWEVLINLQSHLNLAIYYTFTGQAELAESVLNQRWLILYLPTYLFAIWDSYRITVDMNNQFVLAVREDAPVQPFILHPLGINYLDKGSPWAAVVWSMLSPGVGQLILHRLVMAFFLLAAWIVIIYYSKILPVVHYTLLGQFDLARETADKQWLLNIPSLYFFAMYDAYINTVESNKLFEWEQSKFLKNSYQSQNFRMPVGDKGASSMYIISNFQYSVKLEMAITALEMKGIGRDDILAVPLDKRNEKRMLFDRIHYSDSVSLLDFPIILAVIFALFGIIYGFFLPVGPILWALVGTGLGFGTGLLLKLFMVRKQREKKRPESAEVVLIIACQDTQLKMAQDILWDNGALGVSKLFYEPAAVRR